jgi:hypothetical protein
MKSMMVSALALGWVAASVPAQACISAVKEKVLYQVNLPGKEVIKAETGDMITVRYDATVTRNRVFVTYDQKVLKVLADENVTPDGLVGATHHVLYFQVIGAGDTVIEVKQGASLHVRQEVETKLAPVHRGC